MNLTDCLAITFFNAAVCITLPKIISLVQAFKANRNGRLAETIRVTAVPEFTSPESLTEPVTIL